MKGWYRHHSKSERLLRYGLSAELLEWVCESGEVHTFPSVWCNQQRCPTACPEISTQRNNRGTFCQWLHPKQFVFPLSLHTELPLPAVPRLPVFFLPALKDKINLLSWLLSSVLLWSPSGVQNNYQAHFLLVWKHKWFLPACWGLLCGVQLLLFEGPGKKLMKIPSH